MVFDRLTRISCPKLFSPVPDCHSVRHPGYLGLILPTLAQPLMLGSWWAMIVSGLIAILMIVRTTFEDNTLHEELDGYADYAQRARFRLLPGVW